MKKISVLLTLLLACFHLLATQYVCNAIAPINIRNQPSVQGAIIGTLQPKQQVEVIAIKGDWALIKETNQVAFVAARFLSIVTPPSPPSKQISTTQNRTTLSNGRINITSSPSGAIVFVNDSCVGQTPYEMRVDEKSQTIRIEKDGYASFQQTIVVDFGETRAINAKLSPTPQLIPIVLNINVPATIMIDEQQYDSTDKLVCELLEGNHSYQISALGYNTKSGQINVARNRSTTYSLTLKRDLDSIRTAQKIASDSAHKAQVQVFKDHVHDLPWTNTIMLNYLYDGGHSLGLTYARCKFAGFYVNTMIGLNWRKSVGKDEVWNNRYNGDFLLTNQRKDQRLFSLTIGGIIRMGCPLYFYTGLGYGYNKVLYKSIDDQWVEVYTPKGLNNNNHASTYSAFNYQCGLMGTYKGATLSLGYSLLSSYHSCVHHELLIGLGYTF